MRRVIAVAGMAITVFALLSAPASAGVACPPGTTPQPGPGAICIPVVDPGDGGGEGGGGDPVGGGAGSGGGDSTSDPVCDLESKPIDPQPAAGSPYWQGHSPDEGKLYLCIPIGAGSPFYRFVPNGDDPPPDPAELARKALGQLRLARPDVRLAPMPPAKTYVGLETWLWMPADQWSTLKKSVKAGDTTVTVTAVPKSATWDMGPSSETCYSAGREWKVGQMPEGSQTNCSYKYEKISDFEPDNKFNVSSTISYQVDWTCSGECLVDDGTLGLVNSLPGTAAIRVGERQSVVVGGNY